MLDIRKCIFSSLLSLFVDGCSTGGVLHVTEVQLHQDGLHSLPPFTAEDGRAIQRANNYRIHPSLLYRVCMYCMSCYIRTCVHSGIVVCEVVYSSQNGTVVDATCNCVSILSV